LNSNLTNSNNKDTLVVFTMTTVPHDEMVWRGDLGANDIHVIHSNTVLWYFAASPFYDSTSNNAIIYAQAASNANMFYLLQTREALEARLKTMSGLEFIVAQEPSETGPGVGTGVWVIRKQTRRKRMGMDDEITVHAAYFIIGESVYMAPSVADLMNSRVVGPIYARYPYIVLTVS
jgi:mediator of RNA polymerase II transcription subunit 6